MLYQLCSSLKFEMMFILTMEGDGPGGPMTMWDLASW